MSTAWSRCGRRCAATRGCSSSAAGWRSSSSRSSDRRALAGDVRTLAAHRPVIIDESDGTLDAFVRARDLGYRGVSSKTCKGLYKSLINRARCVAWNAADEGNGGRAGSAGAAPVDAVLPPWFLSAEDLTIQAGIALQQDLALVSLLGIGHVERNGHHYVNGMHGLPPSEQTGFLTAHPDLYHRSHGAVRLRIEGGRIAIGSLGGTGFASGAAPDWSAMRAMPPGRAQTLNTNELPAACSPSATRD